MPRRRSHRHHPAEIGAQVTEEEKRVLSHIEKQLLAGHPFFKKFESEREIQNVRGTVTGGRDFAFQSELYRKGHWEHVVEEGEDTRGFSLLLRLDTEAIPKTRGANSQTMPATQILNHVFDGLRDLGYVCRSTPGGVVSSVKYITNEWEFKRKVGGRRDLVTVKGQVFYASRHEQALLMGTIRYELDK